MIGRRWLPAVAWAGLILVLTSLPGQAVPSVAIPHIDKVVHFLLYFVLGGLVAQQVWQGAAPARAVTIALVAVMIFAAADEWHQQFVPGRSADRMDWLADILGAGIALSYEGTARLRRTLPS